MVQVMYMGRRLKRLTRRAMVIPLRKFQHVNPTFSFPLNCWRGEGASAWAGKKRMVWRRRGGGKWWKAYGIRVPHQRQQVVQVVADQRVSAPLREQAEQRRKDGAAAHAGAAHQVQPGLLAVLELELERRLDLHHLGAREVGAGVAFGVVLDQDGQRFFVPVAADEESGAFGDEAGRDACEFEATFLVQGL